MAYPYAPDAEDRIRSSARHIITATAYPNGGGAPVPLDIEDARVEFDDSRAPRIQARLTCATPPPASLDALDARKTFRVKVWAGYKYDSVTEDVQLLADLHARSRGVKRPSNRLTLDVWSDEGLAMDYRRLAWDSQPPQSTLVDALAYHVGLANKGGTPSNVQSDFGPSFGAAAVAGLVQEPGQDSWKLIQEMASRANVAIYCEPDRTWKIAAPQTLASETALNLTTGPGGIIIESDATTSRERFSNAVCIKYAWRDSAGKDQVVYGHAYIRDGAYSLDAIGYNSQFLERDVPATQAQANEAAASTLRALVRRGRSFVVNAISAYWLRPGMTVTATLPEGTQERLLVSAVYFNFPSGQMSLRLRQPEDFEIVTS